MQLVTVEDYVVGAKENRVFVMKVSSLQMNMHVLALQSKGWWAATPSLQMGMSLSDKECRGL